MEEPTTSGLPAPAAGGSRLFADQLLRDGLYDEASVHFRRRLELDPADVSALVGLGRCWLALADPEGAARALSRALELAPDDPGVLVYLAEAHLARGETQQAADLLMVVTLASDASAHAHTLQGELLQREGDMSGAARSYRNALAVDPSCAAAADALAALIATGHESATASGGDPTGLVQDAAYVRLRQHPEALAAILLHEALTLSDAGAGRGGAVLPAVAASIDGAFGGGPGEPAPAAPPRPGELLDRSLDLLRQALARAPGSDELMASMALALEGKGDLPGALDEIHRAIRQAPGQPAHHVHRAGLLAKMGRFEEAATAYRRALATREDDAWVHCSLATVLVRLDRLDEALAEYSRTLAINPRLSVAHLDLATLDARRGRHAEALEHLAAFRDLAPADVRGPARAVDLLLSRGRHRQALVAGQAALERHGTHPDLLLDTGVAAVQCRELAEAESLFRSVLKIDPRSAAALVNLGVVARLRRDRDGAIAFYEQALQVDAHCTEALHDLALARIERRQYEDATGLLRRALAADPWMVEAHHNLGVCLHALGKPREATRSFAVALRCAGAARRHAGALRIRTDPAEQLEDALAAYRQVMQTGPDPPRALDLLLSIWSIHRRQGKLDQAWRTLEGARYVDSRQPAVHLAAGVTAQEAGRFTAAREAYETALKLDPDNPDARLDLVMLEVESGGDVDRALAALERLAADAPHMAEVHFDAGLIHAGAGDPARALASFERAAEVQPSMIEAQLALSQVLQATDPAAAATCLDRALALDPAGAPPWAWLNRGVLSLPTGDHEDALSCVDQALALDPRNALAHHDRGVVLDSMGDAAAAEQAYRQAVALADDPDAYFNLAELLERTGRTAEAKATLEGAGRKLPAAWELKVTAARLHGQAGEFARARDLLDDAAAAAPDDPAVLSGRIVVAFRSGDLDAARAAAARYVELHGGSVHAHLTHGALDLATGDPQAASARFERARELAPDAPGPGLHLAAAALALDRSADALAHADGVLARPDAGREERALANLLRARALAHAGDELAAEDALRRACHLAPDDPVPALALHRHLMARRRSSESLELLRSLAPALSGQPRVQRAMGEASFRDGRFDEAAQHFMAAGPSDGVDPEIAFNSALALAKASRQPEASALLADRRLAGHGPCLALLGRLMLEAEDPDAVEVLERALAAAPDLAEARVNLAGACLARGLASRALSCLAHPGLAHRPDARFQRALAAEAAGRPRLARAEYRRAARAGLAGAWLNLGLLERRAGDYRAELEAYRRAASAGADADQVRVVTAQAHLLRGRPSRAAAVLDAVVAGADDPIVAALRGSTLALQGRGPDALPWLESALRASPGDADLTHNLAYACLLAGREEEGSRAMSALPPRRWAGDALLRACLAEACGGGRAEARRHLDAGIESLSDLPGASGSFVLWVARGNLAVPDDPDGAMHDYLKAFAVLAGPPPRYLLANLGRLLARRAHPWVALRALAEVTGPSRKQLRIASRGSPVFANRDLIRVLRSDYGPRFPVRWFDAAPCGETTGGPS
jgi:tetratricopeptide (TPR) repeat protein